VTTAPICSDPIDVYVGRERCHTSAAPEDAPGRALPMLEVILRLIGT
jgi:hypothetical protein